MNKLKLIGIVLLSMVAGSAHAAVPIEVDAAITSLVTLSVDYGAAFIPLAVAVSLAFIGIKWVRRFIGSST